jgi:glucose-1-phosphate adenylyltransferase
MNAASKMLARTQAFILAGGQGQRLFPLTRDRAKPAVPFGSVHRVIDFTLSNCLNSGLRRVRILTQYRRESLHSYIRALTRRIHLKADCDDALRCVSPVKGKRYRGTADAVFQNLPILENTAADFVVILSGDHIYRMDYRDLLRFHSDCGNQVTMAAAEWPLEAACRFGVLEADSRGHVVGFQEKPSTPRHIFSKPAKSLISMGVYVFNTQTLVHALRDAQGKVHHDFGKDIISELVRNNLVSAYNFTEASTRLGSYWRDVGTVDAYYDANMELLLRPFFFDPYESAVWPVCSVEAHHCTEFWSTGGQAAVDSIIPKGVSIGRGSSVIHSVLSPGVRIDRGAEIRNSILLPNVRVGSGVRIERAIVDENVHIADAVEIGYDSDSDRKHGFVTDTRIVVIPRNTNVGAAQTVLSARAKWRTKLIGEDRIKSQHKYFS